MSPLSFLDVSVGRWRTCPHEALRICSSRGTRGSAKIVLRRARVRQRCRPSPRASSAGRGERRPGNSADVRRYGRPRRHVDERRRLPSSARSADRARSSVTGRGRRARRSGSPPRGDRCRGEVRGDVVDPDRLLPARAGADHGDTGESRTCRMKVGTRRRRAPNTKLGRKITCSRPDPRHALSICPLGGEVRGQRPGLARRRRARSSVRSGRRPPSRAAARTSAYRRPSHVRTRRGARG